MKSRQVLIMILLTGIPSIALIWWCIQSQDTELEFAKRVRIFNLPSKVTSLIGITGITIIVPDLDENDKSGGLTEEQLKKDVEFKLRLAGIKVYPTDEPLEFDNWAHFNVLITILGDDNSSTIIYTVSVDLVQTVKLTRKPFAPFRTTTWETSMVGRCPKSEFAEIVRQTVKDNTDEFINDYLTANPKK